MNRVRAGVTSGYRLDAKLPLPLLKAHSSKQTAIHRRGRRAQVGFEWVYCPRLRSDENLRFFRGI